MSLGAPTAAAVGILESTSVDVLIILFFISASFLWGALSGKSKLLSFLLATYVALFLSPLAFSALDTNNILRATPYRNMSLYGVLLLISFVIFDRSVLRIFSRSAYSWWQAFLMSILAVGLFVAGTLNIISLKGIITISPLTHMLFAGSTAYLLWATIPLIGLYITSKR